MNARRIARTFAVAALAITADAQTYPGIWRNEAWRSVHEGVANSLERASPPSFGIDFDRNQALSWQRTRPALVARKEMKAEADALLLDADERIWRDQRQLDFLKGTDVAQLRREAFDRLARKDEFGGAEAWFRAGLLVDLREHDELAALPDGSKADELVKFAYTKAASLGCELAQIALTFCEAKPDASFATTWKQLVGPNAAKCAEQLRQLAIDGNGGAAVWLAHWYAGENSGIEFIPHPVEGTKNGAEAALKVLTEFCHDGPERVTKFLAPRLRLRLPASNAQSAEARATLAQFGASKDALAGAARAELAVEAARGRDPALSVEQGLAKLEQEVKAGNAVAALFVSQLALDDLLPRFEPHRVAELCRPLAAGNEILRVRIQFLEALDTLLVSTKPDASAAAKQTFHDALTACANAEHSGVLVGFAELAHYKDWLAWRCVLDQDNGSWPGPGEPLDALRGRADAGDLTARALFANALACMNDDAAALADAKQRLLQLVRRSAELTSPQILISFDTLARLAAKQAFDLSPEAKSLAKPPAAEFAPTRGRAAFADLLFAQFLTRELEDERGVREAVLSYVRAANAGELTRWRDAAALVRAYEVARLEQGKWQARWGFGAPPAASESRREWEFWSNLLELPTTTALAAAAQRDDAKLPHVRALLDGLRIELGESMPDVEAATRDLIALGDRGQWHAQSTVATYASRYAETFVRSSRLPELRPLGTLTANAFARWAEIGVGFVVPNVERRIHALALAASFGDAQALAQLEYLAPNNAAIVNPILASLNGSRVAEADLPERDQRAYYAYHLWRIQSDHADELSKLCHERRVWLTASQLYAAGSDDFATRYFDDIQKNRQGLAWHCGTAYLHAEGVTPDESFALAWFSGAARARRRVYSGGGSDEEILDAGGVDNVAVFAFAPHRSALLDYLTVAGRVGEAGNVMVATELEEGPREAGVAHDSVDLSPAGLWNNGLVERAGVAFLESGRAMRRRYAADPNASDARQALDWTHELLRRAVTCRNRDAMNELGAMCDAGDAFAGLQLAVALYNDSFLNGPIALPWMDKAAAQNVEGAAEQLAYWRDPATHEPTVASRVIAKLRAKLTNDADKIFVDDPRGLALVHDPVLELVRAGDAEAREALASLVASEPDESVESDKAFFERALAVANAGKAGEVDALSVAVDHRANTVWSRCDAAEMELAGRAVAAMSRVLRAHATEFPEADRAAVGEREWSLFTWAIALGSNEAVKLTDERIVGLDDAGIMMICAEFLDATRANAPLVRERWGPALKDQALLTAKLVEVNLLEAGGQDTPFLKFFTRVTATERASGRLCYGSRSPKYADELARLIVEAARAGDPEAVKQFDDCNLDPALLDSKP